MPFTRPAQVNPPFAPRISGGQLAWTTLTWTASTLVLRQPSSLHRPLRRPSLPTCGSTFSDTASIPLALLLLRDHQTAGPLRTSLPRRYRRSHAHNFIKGCAAFRLPAWSPSLHAHMRALDLAHAHADAYTNLRSVLDPSIGARPLHRCSTFCSAAGLPRGRRSPGSSPTNGPRPSSDPVKTYTASSPPIRGEPRSSARSHPFALPSGDSLGRRWPR